MSRTSYESSTQPRSLSRWESIDVARGTLLLLMVMVHLISRHAPASQAHGFHQWAGVFLVSAGFVGLSGYMIGARGKRSLSGWGRAGKNALHLILVMFTYGIVISLLEHGLRMLAGGPEACIAEFGWSPPTRFADLGILLPIALVQVMAPLARGRNAASVIGVLLLALGWMLLPEARPLADEGVVAAMWGVLAGRTITPFYTISTFVAVGLVWAVLGRRHWHLVLKHRVTPARRVIALGLAFCLAIPAVSTAVIDPFHRIGGAVLGAAGTLAYWSLVISAFVYSCTAREDDGRSGIARITSLLGRNSLLVFVLHDVLLEIDGFLLHIAGADKNAVAVMLMLVLDAAVLVAAAWAVEHHTKARSAARVLLLDRSRSQGLKPGPFSPAGVIAMAGALSVYSGAIMARSADVLVVDDMEQRRGCPAWWTFGSLETQRLWVEPAGKHAGDHVLQVRGEAPGMYGHGMGLFMHRDLGDRRTLALEVYGYGPDSGRIKIELAEDDNGNWVIEKDSRVYAPLVDDRFVHEIRVDWTGWRQLEISADDFVDDNPGRGNDVFDPRRDLTSGGLLELQLLFAPASPRSDRIKIDIDDIRWLP